MKVGVKLAFFNFNLRNRRAELKMTQAELARIVGTPLYNISRIETMKMPTCRTRDFQGVASILHKIADALCADFHSLFPPEYLRMIETKALPKTSTISFIKEISVDVISGVYLPKQLIAPSAEEVVEKLHLEDDLKKAFSLLSDREREVLINRFGLFGHDKLTLEETARLVSDETNRYITRERIRQIEIRALSRLRHPRLTKLREHLGR